MAFNVTKENSSDLAFARLAYGEKAASDKEFRNWIFSVVEQNDEVPGYLFDVVDLKDLNDIFKNDSPIGFTPVSDLTGDEADALVGIAYLRGNLAGIEEYVRLTRKSALDALERNPQILRRFEDFFGRLSG